MFTLTLYHYTRDPELRPLGLDIKDFDENWSAQSKPVAVAAHIYLSARLQTPENQLRLSKQIKGSFAVRDIPSIVYFHPVAPGGTGAVYFEVGNNRLGPYGLTDAARGIKPAVAAFQMGSHALEAATPEITE